MVVVNLALSVFLTQQYGAIGVVLGSIISFVICVVPPYFWKLPRLFAGFEAHNLRERG
jgi:hypothetical protein